MSEPLLDPISSDLITAFLEAVDLYRDYWSPASPERAIAFRGAFYSIGAVCVLVRSYKDRLPDSVLAELLAFTDAANMDFGERLASERSYAAAAHCLLQLMDRRKTEYRRWARSS